MRGITFASANLSYRQLPNSFQLLLTGQCTFPAPKTLETRIGDVALSEIADDENGVHEDLPDYFP